MARTKKVNEEVVVASNKAAQLLRSIPNIEERAERFAQTIKRNLYQKKIVALITRKEELEDKIDSLRDFSLHVDFNKGMTPVSRESAEKKFEEIIDATYALELLTMELTIKRNVFIEYFGVGTPSDSIDE